MMEVFYKLKTWKQEAYQLSAYWWLETLQRRR